MGKDKRKLTKVELYRENNKTKIKSSQNPIPIED